MTRPQLIGSVTPVRSASTTTELLVLGPSLGTTSALWDDIAADLSDNLRVLRFDLPGHGSSPAASAPLTISDLADAVVDLVDSVGGGAFAYAGISLGGAIGIALATQYPDRISSLVVVCSAAKIGTVDSWNKRATTVRASGTASLVASSAERWFAPGYLDANPSAGGAALSRLVEVDDESYALCCEALAGWDARDQARGIRVPTLCVAGESDIAVSSAEVEQLAADIPASAYAVIAGAAHLPAMERPAELAALLRSRLGGMRTRREVLGDAHVDRAVSETTADTSDFQDFITRVAWGDIWNRPGLARRDRSLLTLASLITGGHDKEFAMHVRAALGNGLTRAEISEAILHTSIYAGFPAANAASAIAKQVFAEQDH